MMSSLFLILFLYLHQRAGKTRVLNEAKGIFLSGREADEMKKPVYLDYNATTPLDHEVAAAMLPFIDKHFGNPSSSYSLGRYSRNAIEQARKQVAALTGCRPDEIVFTSGGTESNNHAIAGAAFAGNEKGRHIITSSIEHPAVMNVCRYLELSGFEVTYLSTDEYGSVRPSDVENALRPDTVLITIMHANNETGAIQPVREIGDIAKRNTILFHTDAAQSAGKIDIRISDRGPDLLSIAGHKLYAPKGIGALFIRGGVKIENLMYGGDQEKGIRPGTENVIHIVALGKACEVALRDFEENHSIMLSTKARLLEGLQSRVGGRIKLNGKFSDTLPNTLSISFDNIDAGELASLIGKEVLISTGAACHSGSGEISPVLRAMNVDPATAAGTVRISTGKFTSFEEIDYAVRIISDAVLKLT